MTKSIVLAVSLAVFAPSAAFAPGGSDEPVSGATGTIEQLGFLAGEWIGELGGAEFRAIYSGTSGGVVLSYSEMRQGSRVGFHEFERFEPVDGRVVFHPYPGGKPATPLTLVEAEWDPSAKTGRAVFENPDKDFPTRIDYHRVSEDRLVITLSHPHGANEEERAKRQVFDLKRARTPR